MKIRIILLALCVGIMVSGFTSDFTAIPQSAGAPVSSTGAPEETTCATSTCHDTAPLNTGAAQTTLTIEGLEQGQYYIPGHTYRIHVRITEPEIVRFGFQIVAVNAQGKNSGTFIVTDAERTQSMHNEVRLTDRQYITYTYGGTAAVETGKGEWFFDWKAPDTEEEVTLYAATVAANNDGTDKGDNTYTISKTLRPRTVSSLYDYALTSGDIRISPNPTDHEVINVRIPLLFSQYETPHCSIVDMHGQEVALVSAIKTAADNLEVRLPKHLVNGVYSLMVTNNSAQVISSFIIQR